MDFYKLLYQNNTKEKLINVLFDTYQHKYVKGMYSNSIAVSYSPNTYFDFISDEKILAEFQRRYIKQLFVTNQKFMGISKHEKEFNLKLENCIFDDVDSDEVLSMYFDQSEKITISPDLIEKVLKENELQIKEMTYRTMESKRKIIIQKNGVLGIDNNLNEKEQKLVKKLIDTLNIGLRVLNNEKISY